MMMPSLFRENLFDELFGVPEFAGFGGFGDLVQNTMHTDVKERDNGYEIDMNLPGFRKEDVRGELKDGYLTITAVSDSSNDTKDDDGMYIRRERYAGSCSRSFYVGKDVTEADVRAKFEDGVLKLFVPKKETPSVVENRHYIPIEG